MLAILLVLQSQGSGRQLLVLLDCLGGLLVREPVLGSDDLLCQLSLCGCGDVWLPWQGGKVGGDAKTVESPLPCGMADNQAIGMCRHGQEHDLANCLAKLM